jgi:hypothetical protein
MEYWKRQRLKEIMKHIGIVLLIITVLIGIVAGIRKYYDQFYLKTEVRTVEVIDKEDDVHHSVIMSGKVLIPVTTHSYYLYGVNNEKVDVSSSIFNTIKEGDEIQVKYTYIYYKKDNSLHKIEYEYLEE